MTDALLARLRPWLRRALKVIGRFGLDSRERFCPVCRGWSPRFEPAGLTLRPDAECPRCGARERHRLMWLFLERRTDMFTRTPLRVLHVAPERCLAPRLAQHLRGGYVTADLSDPRAMVHCDLAAVPFADESFDVILCSHVFEHLPDDRAAMHELYRVLNRAGWAILLVPVLRATTLEDPTVTDPAERARLFGQADHVRVYGSDYVDRLRASGFDVQVSTAREIASAEEITMMGLTSAAGEIYLCART